MKQLKDYLHLYFGCEIGIENSGGVIQKFIFRGLRPKFDENIKVEVNQLLLESPNDQSDPLNEPTAMFWEWPNKCKPILRPLSDMKVEEMQECGNMIYDFSNDEELNKWQPSDFEIGLAPEQFYWLLSKHFDLFGLIEAGLAIDKTKIAA